MTKFFLLAIITMTFLACDGNQYAYSKAVKEDTKRIFLRKKSLIETLAFSGMVVDKEKCDRCDLNKYTILIKLEEMSQEVSFEDQNYPPYYSF